MAEERVPISKVKPGDRITFDSGYYMTGTFVKSLGEYGGKLMLEFQPDGADRARLLSYASHRSVRRG